MNPNELSCLRNRVRYLQPMLDSDHRHSLWYGGDVLEIEYAGAVVTLRANGDVEAIYKPADTALSPVRVRDRCCNAAFRAELEKHIQNDEELTNLNAAMSCALDLTPNWLDQDPPGPWLHLENANWWEVFVDKDDQELESVVLNSDYYDEALTEMLESIDELTRDDPDEDDKFERLKTALFNAGQAAIEDFLGYNFDSDEDKDVTDNRMDQCWMQMPQDELNKFYIKYGI